MNSLKTIGLSLPPSSLSSSPVLGVLSGVAAGSISHVFFLPPLHEKAPLMSLLGNALIGTIPPLLYGNYLGALISIPLSFARVFSFAGLRVAKENGGYQSFIKPIVLATACVAALGKFALDLSLVNTLVLTTFFQSFVDIVVSLIMIIQGTKVDCMDIDTIDEPSPIQP